jgi:hypothetical protein
MPEELPKQIKLLRTIPEISGSAFYSNKHFNRDLMGFQDSLKLNLYKNPALVPPMLWLDSIPPSPVTSIKKSGKKVKWETFTAINEMDQPKRFLIYVNEKGLELNTENPETYFIYSDETEYKFQRINKKKKKYEIRISVLDRLNNESDLSKPVTIKL